MSKIFIAVFFSTLFLALNAQNRCGTISYHDHLKEDSSAVEFEERLQNYLSRQSKRTAVEEEEVYVIPVVVHVIHENSEGEIGGAYNSNISEEQIQTQIDRLNLDFRRKNEDTTLTPSYFSSVAADVKIEFYLANNDPDGYPTNGITRHYSPNLPYNIYNSSHELALKEFGYWPSDQYFNIWVTELTSDVLGQAQFPSGTDYKGLTEGFQTAETDGVVMDYRYFGDAEGTVNFSPYIKYRMGRTLTHEVGHWLGLLHIWGNAYTCAATDYCNDTPPQDDDHGFIGNKQCSQVFMNCENDPSMFMNYMDYSPDACMNIFTKDQKERMRGTMLIDPRRNALLSSPGLCAGKVQLDLPFVELFDEEYEGHFWTVSVGDSAKVSSEHQVNDELLAFEFSDYSYVQLESQVVNMVNNTEAYFLIDFSSVAFDSIQFIYDKSCSENWKVFKTLYTSNFSLQPYQDDLFRAGFEANDLAGQGFLKFRIKIFSQKNVSLRAFEVSQEANNDTQMKVYSNPVDGQLSIVPYFTGEKTVAISWYDCTGRLVDKYYSEMSYKHHLNLLYNYMATGMYILKIEVEGEVYTRKIIINKN